MKFGAIVVGAGKGERLGLGIPKAFVALSGKPLFLHSLETFAAHPGIETVVFVAPEEKVAELSSLPYKIVAGGKTRQDSVRNGLAALGSACKGVLIHDAARPFLSGGLIDRLLERLREGINCIAASPIADTVKRVRENRIQETIDRSQLWGAQTPQAFIIDVLQQALQQAESEGLTGTDEAWVLERLGIPVEIVAGDPFNIKVTGPQDLEIAEMLDVEVGVRIGTGFDIHRMEEGRPLILGGITVPYNKGLAGHSDADSLLHAITDALFGAIAQGDIGQHFPDTDPVNKGLDSRIFLEHARDLVLRRGYQIINIDSTIIAQAPKMAEHIPAMRRNIASILGLDVDQVSVKAKTHEKLDALGKGEGIAAQAVVLLMPEKK